GPSQAVDGANFAGLRGGRDFGDAEATADRVIGDAVGEGSTDIGGNAEHVILPPPQSIARPSCLGSRPGRTFPDPPRPRQSMAMAGGAETGRYPPASHCARVSTRQADKAMAARARFRPCAAKVATWVDPAGDMGSRSAGATRC